VKTTPISDKLHRCYITLDTHLYAVLIPVPESERNKAFLCLAISAAITNRPLSVVAYRRTRGRDNKRLCLRVAITNHTLRVRVTAEKNQGVSPGTTLTALATTAVAHLCHEQQLFVPLKEDPIPTQASIKAKPPNKSHEAGKKAIVKSQTALRRGLAFN
jgi:hypothetical protein